MPRLNPAPSLCAGRGSGLGSIPSPPFQRRTKRLPSAVPTSAFSTLRGPQICATVIFTERKSEFKKNAPPHVNTTSALPASECYEVECMYQEYIRFFPSFFVSSYFKSREDLS